MKKLKQFGKAMVFLIKIVNFAVNPVVAIAAIAVTLMGIVSLPLWLLGYMDLATAIIWVVAYGASLALDRICPHFGVRHRTKEEREAFVASLSFHNYPPTQEDK